MVEDGEYLYVALKIILCGMDLHLSVIQVHKLSQLMVEELEYLWMQLQWQVKQ